MQNLWNRLHMHLHHFRRLVAGFSQRYPGRQEKMTDFVADPIGDVGLTDMQQNFILPHAVPGAGPDDFAVKFGKWRHINWMNFNDQAPF